MTKRNYLELYDFWKNKSLNSGFKFKQFQFHINRFLTEEGRQCPETIAIAAKLAFRALEEEREMELSLQSAIWINQ